MPWSTTVELNLRQIALVAARLAPIEAALVDVFDVRPCHRDPAVAAYGLENVLLPFGRQFLEVVAPTRAGTAAERYLQRRGGDGGYMVITQCDDHDARRRHVATLGVRIAHEFKAEGFRNMQLHPRDTGGSFLEIDQQLSAGDDWLPAGVAWRGHVSTTRIKAIAAAEIQADDPTALAQRWAAIVQRPVRCEAGISSITLGNAELRFVPCTDGRPEGLAGLDIVTCDTAAVLAAAVRQGARPHGASFVLGGMRWRLVSPPMA
ncbi:unnamed protein product [Phaeothamnion confervicola]